MKVVLAGLGLTNLACIFFFKEEVIYLFIKTQKNVM